MRRYKVIHTILAVAMAAVRGSYAHAEQVLRRSSCPVLLVRPRAVALREAA